MDLPETNDTLDDIQDMEVEQQENNEELRKIASSSSSGSLLHASRCKVGPSRPGFLNVGVAIPREVAGCVQGCREGCVSVYVLNSLLKVSSSTHRM